MDWFLLSLCPVHILSVPREEEHVCIVLTL